MSNVCRSGHDLDAQVPPLISSRGYQRCRLCQNEYNRAYRVRKRRQAVRESEQFQDTLRLVQLFVQQRAALEGRWIPSEADAQLLERFRSDLTE